MRKKSEESPRFEAKVSTSAKVVRGGAGGARVAETRSNRAGWETVNGKNTRPSGTDERCTRGRVRKSTLFNGFARWLAHRLTGFSSMDTAAADATGDGSRWRTA